MFLKRKFLTFISFILIAVLVCSSVCLAETQKCTLTVVLQDEQDNPIEDVTVSLCQIAQIEGDAYYPADGFKTSGISLAGLLNNPSAENAAIILDYAKNNQLEMISETAKEGTAVFSDLDQGIWLVCCEEGADYSFPPFIVFLPQVINGQVSYDVTSVPKTEVVIPDTCNIHVLKQWDDDNDANGLRPDSVIVHLLMDGEVADSVELSAENAWSYTFSSLPADGVYAVEEEAVADYEASYNGDAVNGFVITNTCTYEVTDGKLPQTGQMWWPILLLAVAGAAFVSLGVIEIKGKGHGKQTK